MKAITEDRREGVKQLAAYLRTIQKRRARERAEEAKEERPGRNPITGEQVTISARRVVTWRPSGVLRERMKGAG